MSENLGNKIKVQRKKKLYTLKDLSDKTGLSTGFLSQLERGLTTVALDSLGRIAEALDVDISFFIPPKSTSPATITRSYERRLLQVLDNRFIHYSMENGSEDTVLLPRVIEILPAIEQGREEVEIYQHEGEEFIYVLEGVLTLKLGSETSQLFPGDSAHYKSTTPHNWENKTNRNVKLLAVHTPNYITK